MTQKRGPAIMCCERIERQLGRYIDGELTASERAEVEAHLKSCANCRADVAELRQLVGEIALPHPVSVPPSLFAAIERRLHQADPAGGHRATVATSRQRLRFAPWPVAASIILALGLGLVGLSSLEPTVEASTIDFGVLLDALPLDAHKAFRKFLLRYDAKETTPIAAKRTAAKLNFATPDVLPGGFELQAVYDLRIGSQIGIAARYDRDGEFLAVVFHPPMDHERFGSHPDYPCIIGAKCGHKIEVGAWKLVHITDPTTCHCLLSRVDEASEMPRIMKAVAPSLPGAAAVAQPQDARP